MTSFPQNTAVLDEQPPSATGSSSTSMYAQETYRPSPSPSVTSQSDDPDREDFEEEEDDEDDYTDVGASAFNIKDRRNTLKARGSAALVPKVNNSESWSMTPASAMNASAATLPHEILLHIFKYVAINPPDLRRSLSVCKSWCLCGVELLWHRPSFYRISSLFKLIHILRRPDPTFPYANFVRRLNLSLLATDLEDSLFSRMAVCTRLERITLTGCTQITDDTIANVLQNTTHLVAADFSEVTQLTDKSILTIAANCPRLQGINLTGCKNITSSSIAALAKSCKLLRRVKLCGCELIGDEALTALAEHCPVLLEVDLIKCPLITDASVRKIWQHCFHMRELRLAECGKLTDLAFPAPPSMLQGTGSASSALMQPLAPMSQLQGGSVRGSDSAPTSRGASPFGASAAVRPLVFSSSHDQLPAIDTPMHTHLRPSRLFDHLRILDLTSCNTISDTSIEGIVTNVPRIRNLILAKCTRLTNESAYSIARLGKNLHYLHLGHVSNLTDRAVCHLARSCTRLRYIDLACCPQLTDLSVLQLAENLPKLRRIGLVRVSNLTDHSIYGLVTKYTSLERIHLSYCENVSVPAIFWLLERLNRLTHLSLTGVPAFRRPELQSMCREPPREFNAHQRAAFCVYSGKGVHELRKFLQGVYTDNQTGSPFGDLPPEVHSALAQRNEHAERRAARYRLQQQPLHQQQQQQQQQYSAQPTGDADLPGSSTMRHLAPLLTRHLGINLDQAMAAQQHVYHSRNAMSEPTVHQPLPSVPFSYEAGSVHFSTPQSYRRDDSGEQTAVPMAGLQDVNTAEEGRRSHDSAFERMDEDIGGQPTSMHPADPSSALNTPLAGPLSYQPHNTHGGFEFRTPPDSRAAVESRSGYLGAGQTLGTAPGGQYARFQTNPGHHSLAALATPPLPAAHGHEGGLGSGGSGGMQGSDLFVRFDSGQRTPIATRNAFVTPTFSSTQPHQASGQGGQDASDNNDTR